MFVIVRKWTYMTGGIFFPGQSWGNFSWCFSSGQICNVFLDLWEQSWHLLVRLAPLFRYSQQEQEHGEYCFCPMSACSHYLVFSSNNSCGTKLIWAEYFMSSDCKHKCIFLPSTFHAKHSCLFAKANTCNTCCTGHCYDRQTVQFQNLFGLRTL